MELVVRTKSLVLHMTEATHARVKAEAKARGMSMSEFIRKMVNDGWRSNSGNQR